MRTKKNTCLVNPWLFAKTAINKLFGLCQFCHTKWGKQASRTKKVQIFRKKHMHTASWLPKGLGFFEKNICILLVSYLIFSVKQMLFQPPIYQQNKGEGVCFYLIISMNIYLYYLYLLCMFVFICTYLWIHRSYSRQWA